VVKFVNVIFERFQGIRASLNVFTSIQVELLGL